MEAEQEKIEVLVVLVEEAMAMIQTGGMAKRSCNFNR